MHKIFKPYLKSLTPLPPNLNVAKWFGDVVRVDKTNQTPEIKTAAGWFSSVSLLALASCLLLFAPGPRFRWGRAFAWEKGSDGGEGMVGRKKSLGDASGVGLHYLHHYLLLKASIWSPKFSSVKTTTRAAVDPKRQELVGNQTILHCNKIMLTI